MRLTRFWPGGFDPKLGSRLLARLTVSAALIGLLLSLAWPALVAAQVDQQEPESLSGVYTVTIGRNDLPPGLAGGPALVGFWTITFNDDGTYEVARQDVGTVATGSFSVEGATLTFNDWGGVVSCAPAEERPAIEDESAAAATYAWRVDGDILTLTPISETCKDRRVLLNTRTFSSYAPCVTSPLGMTPEMLPAGTPVGTPAATPVTIPEPSQSNIAVQEGLPRGADPAEAINVLLQQASGCWATGDPARFLPLHTTAVVEEVLFTDPSLSTLRMLMSTPVSFERIGEIEMVDPTHATAYVEITFGGEAIPQLFTFALEDGVWLMDLFFLFGPPTEGPPAGSPNA